MPARRYGRAVETDGTAVGQLPNSAGSGSRRWGERVRVRASEHHFSRPAGEDGRSRFVSLWRPADRHVRPAGEFSPGITPDVPLEPSCSEPFSPPEPAGVGVEQ